MPKKAATKKAPPTPETPPLAGFAITLEEAIALCIWKCRHTLPAPLVTVTPADRAALAQSLEYNEQTVKVNIDERNGSIFIHLTDQKTNDQIVFFENNEADLDKQQAAANVRQLRSGAPQLVGEIKRMLARGDISDSLITEVCDALLVLAKAPA